METLSTGHLFAGIDGLGLGLEPHGFRTAWFSEYEDAPSRVLAHHYPYVPNHGDITAIDWSKVEPVEVLTGGFPCQDLSYAGKGAGIKEGTRSGLWFEYVRAIRALRPRIVIVENVAALLGRGLDIVLGDLAACGFDASWSVLRASDVGAAHRRERLFIVATAAYGGGDRRQRGAERYIGTDRPELEAPLGYHAELRDPTSADADLVGRLDRGTGEPDAGVQASDAQGRGPARRDWIADLAGRPLDYGPAIRRWERTTGRAAPAPTIDGRLSAQFVEWHMGFPDGWVDVLSRTQALKALGNAVVPQCANVIGRWALELAAQQEAA